MGNINLFSFLVIVGAGSGVAAQSSDQEQAKKDGERVRQQCKSGNGEACFEYAHYIVSIKKDFFGLRQILIRGCELENQDSCEELRRVDGEGEEIRRNCEGGDAAACELYGLGLLYMYGRLSDATDFFEKACSMGKNESCRMLSRYRFPSP
jgi:TPR repeat protein